METAEKVLRKVAEFEIKTKQKPTVLILGTAIVSKLKKESRFLLETNSETKQTLFCGIPIIEPFNSELSTIILPALTLDKLNGA